MSLFVFIDVASIVECVRKISTGCESHGEMLPLHTFCGTLRREIFCSFVGTDCETGIDLRPSHINNTILFYFYSIHINHFSPHIDRTVIHGKST